MDPRVVQLVESVLTTAADPRLTPVLQDVADTARDVIGVDYAALGVLDDERMLARFVHAGVDAATVERIGHLPRGHGLLGWQSRHAVPLRLDDVTSHPAAEGFPSGHPTMTTFLSVPVWVEGRHFGNLYMSDRTDGQPFDQGDQDLAVVMAAVAGSAIATVRHHAELRRLSLLEDRERIGRDLHDTVIQRLFATGLSLQALARRLEDVDEPAAARLADAVDDLDETIRTVRSTIFSLRSDDPDAPLSTRVARLVGQELPRVLGLTPELSIDGAVDELGPASVADELVAVLREALTNVARHADASRVEVRVGLRDGWLEVTVTDDGVGLPPAATGRGMGLRNIIGRAARLGGDVSMGGGGTGAQISWRVPVED